VGRNDAAGFFYYVMELADDARHGPKIEPEQYVAATLEPLCRGGSRLPARESVRIGAEIARGLAFLHGRGLVHRDIKPSNIVFVAGRAKLADIGLVAAATAAVTQVGTAGYMPPEGPGNASADVYSLGRVLYELATGLGRTEFPRLPPDFTTAPDRALLIQLNRVVMRACDPQPARRYADARELLADLEALEAGKRPGRGLRVYTWAAAAVLAAGAIVFAGRVALRRWPAPRPTAAAIAPATTEAARLTAQALDRARKVNFTRDDLEVARELSRQATGLDPFSAHAWGVAAWVEASYINRHWDAGIRRKQEAERLARHALSLDPDEPEGLNAMTVVLLIDNAWDAADAEIRHAVAAAPRNAQSWRLLLHVVNLKRRVSPDRQAIVQKLAQLFPNDPIVQYDLSLDYMVDYVDTRDPVFKQQTLAAFHAISRLHPMPTALLQEAIFDMRWTGDLADMRQALDQLAKMPVSDQADDRAVYVAAMGCLFERHPERVSAITALTSRPYLEDLTADCPRDWLDAMAQIEAGHFSEARTYWEGAEAALRPLIAASSADASRRRHYTAQLATTLARLGQREEAAKLAAEIESLTHDGMDSGTATDLAYYYLALGDGPRALACARVMGIQPYWLKYDPWWDPVRGTPEYEAVFAQQMKRSR